MANTRQRLAEFFKKFARKRGITLGQKFAREIQDVLSVQAPVRRLPSGRLVAVTPAKPFAPPRMVSGKLRASVKVTETRDGCRVRIGKKYGMPLEFRKNFGGFPHEFMAVAARRLGIKLKTRY